MEKGHVFTIGHGSHSQDSLLEQLTQKQISYLIDVRSIPYSRYQPEFSQRPLEQLLRERSLRYVFMGDLLGGRPKANDCYTDGKADYSKIREKDFFLRGIDRLKNAYQQGLRICLLCSEGHPSQCHRSKLICAALEDQGISSTHLLPDGSQCSQAEIMTELTQNQRDLFGEHFTSRKSYR